MEDRRDMKKGGEKKVKKVIKKLKKASKAHAAQAKTLQGVLRSKSRRKKS
jgi:hypothetical protein|tara:strand:+ start:286 stop:435 length:150 start_codon:yes stop_codon:yes gene_type:complete